LTNHDWPKSAVYHLMKNIIIRPMIGRINPDSIENIIPNLTNSDWSKSLRLLERLMRLDSSPILQRVARYFLERKASTSRILRTELNLPKSTVTWALQQLADIGFIEPVSEVKQERGRPAIIYATPDASKEDIKQARIRHRRLSSPKYRAAEKLAQTLLTKYLEKNESSEISIREILIFVREVKLPYSSIDVAEIVAELLSEKGIKIWR